MERSALSAADALDIVATAKDVQAERAEAADGAGAPLWRSHSLLSAIGASSSGTWTAWTDGATDSG